MAMFSDVDTGLEILAIVLTGNVLLVKGSDAVVAWLLTEEGVVGGTFGQRRVDRNNSLWDMPYQVHPNLLSQQKEENSDYEDDEDLDFSVGGEIVVIRQYGDPIHLYNTNTGEILNLDRVHQGIRYYFTNTKPWSGFDHYHMDTIESYEHPDCGWPVSETNLQEGWVKDPEGKHRLRLHPRWRLSWNYVHWLGQVTTLQLQKSSELVVVKF